VIERMLWSIGIPSLTVCTDELASYGKVTYLVVAALPNRRPMVLATLYVLADGLRDALGQRREVIDVGFTGKILATAAMLHLDHRGLALPGTVTPLQLGVTLAPDSNRARCERWLADLRAAGVRCEARTVPASSRARARAEKAWHRQGVPLVIGLDRTPGSLTLCSRMPLRRTPLADLPGPQAVLDHLARHDARLRAASQRLLDTTVERNGHLRTLCPDCAAAPGTAVFGRVVPATPGRCETCGDPAGRALFLSEEGRFY
jgi:prolyl-tRNA synthetase